MRIRSLLAISFLVLLCLTAASGQRNHTPKWKSGSTPNIFDSLETQAEDTKAPTAAETAALRQQRDAKVTELGRELDGIIRTATALQEQLKTADANNVLSLELRNQGKLLEDSAHKIRKQISSL
jgi:hypothetical protein